MSWLDSANPFVAPGRWFKGALHTHTSESDGSMDPASLARAYRELGYDFVFFTDHNKITGLGIPEDGFLTLPGVEVAIAHKNPDKYWHLVGLCLESLPSAKFDSPARMYDLLRSKAAFCVLAHPYWSQLTGKDLMVFDGLPAVEIWNTGCEQEIGRGCSEYQWDWALGAGRRIAGVAVDDCHGFDDVGKGWVTVKSEELSAEGLINALSKGMFYSSCGPEIRALRVSPAGIEVETSPCRSIAFVADRQAGKYYVAEPDASGLALAAYRFRGKETYVRVEIVDAQGRKAWSNPIYPEWPEKEGLRLEA